MLKLEKAKKNPTLSNRLTGISLETFEEKMKVLAKASPELKSLVSFLGIIQPMLR